MENVLSIFTITLECLALKKLGQAFLEYKDKKMQIIWNIGYILFSFIAYNFFIVDVALLRYALSISLGVFLLHISFYGKGYFKLLLTIISLVLIYTIDYIVILFIMFITDSNFQEIMDSRISFGVVVMFSKFLLYMISYIVCYLLKRKAKTHMYGGQEIILITPFPIFSFFTIILSLYLSIEYEVSSVWVLANAMGIIIASLAMLAIIDKLGQDKQVKQDNIILQQRIKSEMASLESVIESYTQQRKMTHDFNNHLLTIDTLLNKQEYNHAKSYISENLKITQEQAIALNSNNLAVDIIVNQKYAKAVKNNISVRLEVNDLSKIAIDDRDIIIILSNALDNAIKAAADTSQKIIKVKITNTEEDIVISIINTSHTVEVKDNQIISNAQTNLINGYGLKNIKSAVEKYNGVMALSYNDGWFQLSIIICT